MPPISRPSNWRISLTLAIGILSASTSAILIRLAFQASNVQGVGFSLVLAASRLILASLVLLPTWGRSRQISVQGNAHYYSIAAGVFLALHFASWITSLTYTSIAASTALVNTNPIWVALISWLWLGERPTLISTGGILLTLLGGVWVGLGGNSFETAGSHPALGNALAVLGALAVSLYFLLGREAQQRGLKIGSHVVITYATAALVLLPLPLLFGVSYFGYPAEVYGYILLLAIFPQLIGHTSFNWAVRWISPTLVTLVILAEPVGSSLLGFIVFRENPGLAVLLGAVIIIVGVAIAAIGAKPKTTKPVNNDSDPK